jgi:hypothetical protein
MPTIKSILQKIVQTDQVRESVLCLRVKRIARRAGDKPFA